MIRDNLRNNWEARLTLTELPLKGNVFNRKRIDYGGAFSFPRCTVSQPCFLSQSFKKQALNTVLTDINQITYNLIYFEKCWTKKIKNGFYSMCIAWYNDVNKDESLKNLLVNRKVFMLIEFYLPGWGRKGRFVRFVIDKSEEKVTKVIQNYLHKSSHFSVSQNKEPLF